LTVTVEENVAAGGFGSAVLESAARRGETACIRCLGLPDSFVEQGSPEELRADLGLDAKGIGNFIKGELSRDLC
jgi:1-deoxy-D-xylulose-5-phosphate synthase